MSSIELKGHYVTPITGELLKDCGFVEHEDGFLYQNRMGVNCFVCYLDEFEKPLWRILCEGSRICEAIHMEFLSNIFRLRYGFHLYD